MSGGVRGLGLAALPYSIVRRLRGARTQENTPQRPKRGGMAIHFFQRLGNVRDRNGRLRNGVETLFTHLEHMRRTGTDVTWFCTDSLARGVSKARLEQFQASIDRGEQPHAFFMIGPRAGGSGDIEWAGRITDILSAAFGMPCPEPDLCPPCWQGWGRTWLKLQGLAPTRNLTLADFCVEGSGQNLAAVVGRSQYKCGYIAAVRVD